MAGIGRAAGHRTAAILDAGPAAMLVSVGFAGGLDPGLDPGDLVVAGTYRRLGGETVGDARVAAGAAALLAGCGIAATAGVVLTSDELLLTPESKRRARAGSDGLVVDMEGFWLASAARDRGVPHIGLHCVVDEADAALPDFVSEVAADPRGREWTHALGALRSAGNVRDLAILALRARTATRVLARSARAVLGAVADGALTVGGPGVAPGSPLTSTRPESEGR